MVNDHRDRLPFLIIPAYEPEGILLSILTIIKNSFYKIIIVDDGSSGANEKLFIKIGEIPNTVMLKHPKNLGKGAALKTAFKYCIKLDTRSCGAVTMDADGQHCSDDVKKIGTALMNDPYSLHLGKREFTREVPWKSLVGNSITKFVYSIFVGSRLSDTQSGLRGIPLTALPKLLEIKSNAYDYELGMLLFAEQNHVKINEIPITTIYSKNNSTTHFKPLIDSVKIYSVFLKYLINSIVIGIIDLLVFIFVYKQTNEIFVSYFLGRLVFCYCSYKNSTKYFQASEIMRGQIIRYILLVLCSLFLSYSFASILMLIYGINIIFAKLIAEISLFLYNFSVQQSYIFNRAKSND